MDILTKSEVLKKISEMEPFECYLDDASLYMKITEYTNYISTAIHNGHKFRRELEGNCLLDDNERYHEEDPYTADMILDSPILLVPQDSRYEYDLNRNPNDCIHENAWGKAVWKNDMSSEEREISLKLHQQFYEICNHLIETLLVKHTTIMLFDVHSYNILDRDYINPPLFNIGTHFVDMEKYGFIVQDWMNNLNDIVIPNIEVVVKENDVYYGKGYLAESVRGRYPNCLVIPTEVKKIYANEVAPEPYVEVIEAIRQGFRKAMLKTKNQLLKL